MMRFFKRPHLFCLFISGRAKGPHGGAYRRSTEDIMRFCGFKLSGPLYNCKVAWRMAGNLTGGSHE